MIKIKTLLTDETIKALKAGDEVRISGTLYIARDQAHKRLCDALKKGAKLSIPLKGQIIYYAGPTPAPKGRAIGSCGPTTASRMDSFTPQLLKAGLKGMIGKGRRGAEVVKAVKRYKAIYFVTIGGAGVYLSQRIKKSKLVAYPELGPEAIYKVEVEDFPAWVAVDSCGKSIY